MTFLLLNQDEDFKRCKALKIGSIGNFASRETWPSWKYYHRIARVAASAGQTDLFRQFLGPPVQYRLDNRINLYAYPGSFEDLVALLSLAAGNGHIEFVAFLMEGRHRDASDASFDNRHLHYPVILQKAAKNGHEDLVRWCLSRATPKELKVRDILQPRSAYIAAASGGFHNIMRILTTQENWRARDLEGALSRAAYFGYTSVVKQMLDEGLDLTANTTVVAPQPRILCLSKARVSSHRVTPLLLPLPTSKGRWSVSCYPMAWI